MSVLPELKVDQPGDDVSHLDVESCELGAELAFEWQHMKAVVELFGHVPLIQEAEAWFREHECTNHLVSGIVLGDSLKRQFGRLPCWVGQERSGIFKLIIELPVVDQVNWPVIKERLHATDLL